MIPEDFLLKRIHELTEENTALKIKRELECIHEDGIHCQIDYWRNTKEKAKYFYLLITSIWAASLTLLYIMWAIKEL